MQFDVRELAWQDLESGKYVRVLELSEFNNEDLVWYEHFDTGKRHCMSVDIFVSKHKAAGVYTNYGFEEESTIMVNAVVGIYLAYKALQRFDKALDSLMPDDWPGY